jgi:hypothetical protein
MRHDSLETVEISLKFGSQGRECVSSVHKDRYPQVLEFRDMALRHTWINSAKCPMLPGTPLPLMERSFGNGNGSYKLLCPSQ